MCKRARLRRLGDMIVLVHLLQHLGLPSGIAVAAVIAGRKLLKRSGNPRTRNRREPGRRQRRSQGYR
jgi:hypothetical protein